MLRYTTYAGSNGGLFSSQTFCRKTLPYLDELSFSIHGPNPEQHNLLTQNNQSFRRLKKTLTNIKKIRATTKIFANIVVTLPNFYTLIDTINYISDFKIFSQILISNLAPEGNGAKHFKKLAVPLELFKKNINKLVLFSKSHSLALRFFGMPLCTLGNHWKNSNDIWWSPRATVEKWLSGRKVTLKTTFSYAPDRNRIKTTRCRTCKKQHLCGGIFKRYFQEFGGKELKPFC